MNTLVALVFLAAIGLLLFYKLVITALGQRSNLRAGLRLGPGSFFIEVKDQKKDEPPPADT